LFPGQAFKTKFPS